MLALNLSAVTFQSPDPARLAEFYRDALGIPLTPNQHGTTAEHNEGLLAGIHIAVLRAAPNFGGPIVPVFRVANLEAAIAHLNARQAMQRFKPIPLGEGKRVAGFADPDGNMFRLIEIDPNWSGGDK